MCSIKKKTYEIQNIKWNRLLEKISTYIGKWCFCRHKTYKILPVVEFQVFVLIIRLLVSIMVHGREGTEHCNPWIAYYYYTACLILKITSTMGMIVEVPIIFFFFFWEGSKWKGGGGVKVYTTRFKNLVSTTLELVVKDLYR